MNCSHDCHNGIVLEVHDDGRCYSEMCPQCTPPRWRAGWPAGVDPKLPNVDSERNLVIISADYANLMNTGMGLARQLSEGGKSVGFTDLSRLPLDFRAEWPQPTEVDMRFMGVLDRRMTSAQIHHLQRFISMGFPVTVLAGHPEEWGNSDVWQDLRLSLKANHYTLKVLV